jgi:transposase
VNLYFNKNVNVWCVDEKSGVQAIERKKWQKKRQVRMETDYKRHSTANLFAAFNVHTGEVFAKATLRRTQQDVNKFIEELAAKNKGKKIYVIWDNLNTHLLHKFEKFKEQIEFVYTPKHASWVNQVEIFFGILQKKVLKHASFKSVFDLCSKMMLFVRGWNERAHPFKWRFGGFHHKT